METDNVEKVQYLEDTEGRKYAWLPPAGRVNKDAVNAAGEWTVHEDGYGILHHHPKYKDGVGMVCRCADRMEAEYTVTAINAALASLRQEATTQQAAERETIENLRVEAKQNWKVIEQLREQLAAEREKLRDSDASVCSLLALAAVVKGHPETPQNLKDLASKELLDHNRGAYLINEVRTLRKQLAAEREKHK